MMKPHLEDTMNESLLVEFENLIFSVDRGQALSNALQYEDEAA